MEETFFYKLQGIFNTWFVVLIVLIGLFSFFWDGKMLENEKLKKESKMAKAIGITYVFVGLALYIFFKI